MQFIDSIRNTIRGIIKEIAILVDSISNGLIRPNHVTTLSLLGHIVIGLAIVSGRFPEAALMLIAFGLMDTLDGELARVQSSGSDFGALYDAVTDRIKEAIIFIAFVVYFTDQQELLYVGLSASALAASIVVSYIKSKLETHMLSRSKTASPNSVNKQLATGLFRYEIRMAVLVVALVVGVPEAGIAIILVGALYTMFERAHYAYITLSETTEK